MAAADASLACLFWQLAGGCAFIEYLTECVRVLVQPELGAASPWRRQRRNRRDRGFDHDLWGSKPICPFLCLQGVTADAYRSVVEQRTSDRPGRMYWACSPHVACVCSILRKLREQAEDRREDHKPKFIQPHKDDSLLLLEPNCLRTEKCLQEKRFKLYMKYEGSTFIRCKSSAFAPSCSRQKRTSCMDQVQTTEARWLRGYWYCLIFPKLVFDHY